MSITSFTRGHMQFPDLKTHISAIRQVFPVHLDKYLAKLGMH